MPHTTQRFEFNRSLTRILARHSVNLDSLSLSIAGPLVCFSGRLEPHHSGAFTAREIRSLIHDLEALPYRLRLQFHLDNMQVEKHGGAWGIAPRHSNSSAEYFGDGFIASAMLHAGRTERPTCDDDF
ncbi:hypothetical protein DPQ33_10235 [Oceanidesulfovibrio indonesiensis]|uniref:Uncharacterized protein n=1 Tax=Oceanidesulfovibrio indonesiensis TaxID=54767 RepID=A0A7M3MEJ0_9BACT|nr:hypothetical protein [Oceanidesulfovibrio indonesiensis]TVM17161.1 hypothetical protein DPQ33_10235 [Oceanidesulfovibrio indonesiensis]